MALIKTQDVDERLEHLYQLVANEEDARSCRELAPEACRWVPRNFFVYLMAHTLTNLGDALSSPKTVLTWVMTAVGAPMAMISLLVPIRESGSMLPQLALGGWVRSREMRKPIWLVGSALQGASILACALAAFTLTGKTAGMVILGCVVAFSLARSLNSIVSKDVVGKTIPKGRRGRLGGWSAGVSGLLTLGVGLSLMVMGRQSRDAADYALLLLAAGSMWFVAMLVFTFLQETPGETAGGKNGWRAAWRNLGLVISDRPFRLFVLTRALLLCSALTAPYYVVLARNNGTGTAAMLGVFMLAGGLASSLSAPVWGTMADRSARLVMIRAAILTGALGIAAFAVTHLLPDLGRSFWLWPMFFFVLGVAHAGVRAGRKTYLLDLAGGVKRTDYVSVSNTLIAIVLLGMGAITGALSFLPPEVIIAGLSVLGLGGALLAGRLPEVQGR
ncbi:MFS transporter [bacterium DOLJORAL78_65_58]|nr:MAG: MFS transporter [bacterium DOLZORAL124_64_63]PIE76393.1 MAG: MFS transporter [bacterium DOLJORAL78_65_58]